MISTGRAARQGPWRNCKGLRHNCTELAGEKTSHINMSSDPEKVTENAKKVPVGLYKISEEKLCNLRSPEIVRALRGWFTGAAWGPPPLAGYGNVSIESKDTIDKWVLRGV